MPPFLTETGKVLRLGGSVLGYVSSTQPPPDPDPDPGTDNGSNVNTAALGLRSNPAKTAGANFSENYYVGTFWDGSYWAVPNASQVHVTSTFPQSQQTSGTYTGNTSGNAYASSWTNSWVNGVGVNYTGADTNKNNLRQPFDERAQDYSSANILYDHSLNVAPEVKGTLSLNVGDVMWKCYSGEANDTVSGRTPVWSYMTLKVMNAAPPSDAFRPSMYSNSTSYYRLSDMDWTGWQNLPVPSGAMDNTPEEIAARVKRVYPMMYLATHSESIRPASDWGTYWAYAGAVVIAEALVYLHCNIDPAVKDEIRAGIVQYGIDLYHRYEADTLGPSGIGDDDSASINGAGHDMLRTLPLLIASQVLNDSAMYATWQNLNPTWGDNERAQCFWISDFDTDNPRDGQSTNRPTEPYRHVSNTDTDRGRPGWRQYARIGNQLHIATASMDCAYRDISNFALTVAATCIQLAGLDDAHDWGAWFHYCDWYNAIYKAGNAVYEGGGSVYFAGWQEFVNNHRFSAAGGTVGKFYGDMATVTGGSGQVTVDLIGTPVGDATPLTRVEYRVNGVIGTLKSHQARTIIPGFLPNGNMSGNFIVGKSGAPFYQANVVVSGRNDYRQMQSYEFAPTVRGGTSHTVSAPAGTTQIELRAVQGSTNGPWRAFPVNGTVT